MIYDNTTLKARLKVEIRAKIELLGISPVLDIIQVGDDFASNKYVGIKQKIGAELGIIVNIIKFDQGVEVAKVIEVITKGIKNRNGLIVQLPLPTGFESILESIPTHQDVDFLTPSSNGLWAKGLLPPTIGAIDLVLKDILGDSKNNLNLDFGSKQVVVVGQGKLVGIPATRYFMARGAVLGPKLHQNLQVVDINTPNPAEICRQADILIGATGVAGLIKPDWIKAGAIVVDAGTSEVGGQQAGDVDITSFPENATLVPSPGGIGPITVLCLFGNLVNLIKLDY